MQFLFIHQNFPGQYRHLVRALANTGEHDVYFITRPNQNQMRGVRKLLYDPEVGGAVGRYRLTREFDAGVQTGLAVLKQCRSLRASGVRPDIILGHSGWGETLFVKDVFPESPLLSYFEFFYQAEGADVGFDPEFSPSHQDDRTRLSVRNAINRLTFAASDWGNTPTNWQRSLYPAAMQDRITTLHEGVDTTLVAPADDAWLKLARRDLSLTRSDEVITYVARNLEPYRGFHILMRSLPEILRRRPRAHVVIVGGDGVSYGDPPPRGGSFREMLLREVGVQLDPDRVHFLGQIPHDAFLNVLQVSSAHIYLTYPFVLSWSLIEAMAAGCLVIGSATPPVQEVLQDGDNGLLFDFFSPDALCDRIDEVFEHSDRMAELRASARATAVADFDLRTSALPRWLDLIGDLIGGVAPATDPPVDGPATWINLR
jgi:glycosyltransferase involved in cell wall biosynthesis